MRIQNASTDIRPALQSHQRGKETTERTEHRSARRIARLEQAVSSGRRANPAGNLQETSWQARNRSSPWGKP